MEHDSGGWIFLKLLQGDTATIAKRLFLYIRYIRYRKHFHTKCTQLQVKQVKIKPSPTGRRLQFPEDEEFLFHSQMTQDECNDL